MATKNHPHPTHLQIKIHKKTGGKIYTERKKVKNVEKSPWGQCLTRLVPNGRPRSGFSLVPENLCFSGTNQKPERRRPFGTGLVRHRPQGLFSPLFTFLRATFFRPFRLSLVPTICPWVSEDGPKSARIGSPFLGCPFERYDLQRSHVNQSLILVLRIY